MRTLLALAMLLLLPACEMRMREQDRLETWEENTARHGRLPPEHAIARGDLVRLERLETRPPLTPELMPLCSWTPTTTVRVRSRSGRNMSSRLPRLIRPSR